MKQKMNTYHKALAGFLFCIASNMALAEVATMQQPYGVVWECPSQNLVDIKKNVDALLYKNKLNTFVQVNKTTDKLHVYIPTQYAAGSTLYLSNNPLFHIKKERITKTINGRKISKNITSKKEILIALLYPGRLTKFKGDISCKADALSKTIQLRQNIVFWGTDLGWGWPDGDSAVWNKQYWNQGTPLDKSRKYNEAVTRSFNDLFLKQRNYKIGCYTATKAVFIQAYLDFYNHKKQSGVKDLFFQSLLKDNEPFVGIEPQDMWYFEEDYIKDQYSSKGKILKIQKDVDSGNFIPGDWVYMRNTDKKTNQKIGYEGSNTIYLGGGVFSDYYDDYRGGYPYERKLDEVYQWRNGVFSRSHHHHLIQNLNNKERQQLTGAPKDGGIVEDYRVAPILF